MEFSVPVRVMFLSENCQHLTSNSTLHEVKVEFSVSVRVMYLSENFSLKLRSKSN